MFGFSKFNSTNSKAILNGISTVPRRVAFFELSYNCNFCCPFCYVPWLDHEELYGTPLSASQWLMVSDQVVNEDFNGIQLCGGEPSLHPEFVGIVSGILCRHPSIPLCIFTNGMCLTDDFLTLVEGKNVFIATSLQGIQTRKEMTGSSTTLSAWERGCKNVCRHSIPLEIQITVTKRNLYELEKMIDCSLRLAPEVIQINPLVVEGRAKYHPDLWLSLKDRNTIDEIAKTLSKTAKCPIVVDPEPYCVSRDDSIAPEGSLQPIVPVDCLKCKLDIVIGPDGRRRSCLHSPTIMKHRDEPS